MVSRKILDTLRPKLNYSPKDDNEAHSYYTVNMNRLQNGKQLKPVQIRISDHGTFLRTWLDFAFKADSKIRLVDPSRCINYSIVFVDENASLTKDCEGRPNCDNCDITCIPTLVRGITQKGKSFEVYQYVYQSSDITEENIDKIIADITQAYTTGKFDGTLATLKPSFKEMVPWEPEPKSKKNDKQNPKPNNKGNRFIKGRNRGIKDSAYDTIEGEPLYEETIVVRFLDNKTLIRKMFEYDFD